MTDSVEQKKARYAELFRNALALVAILVVTINGASKAQEYVKMYESGTLDLFINLPPLILFVLTILHGVSWYISATQEYGLFERYYSNLAPERPTAALIVSILIPSSIVLLAYFADRIEIYCLILGLYVAINMFARWITARVVARLVVDAKDTIKAEVNEEFGLLYVDRPHQLLNLFILAAALASAFILYIVKIELPAPANPRVLSYAMISVALVLTEIIIWSWRSRMYQRLA